MKFNLRFLRGLETVAEIKGIMSHHPDEIESSSIAEAVIETESFLEKLTGLRVHIIVVMED